MTTELQIKFESYNQDNPHIYQAFERYALLAGRHRGYFGAKNIMERLRWDSMIEGDDDFKINNNYAAYYARLFEQKNPRYEGFFRKRSV